jgi:hypothetical protein
MTDLETITTLELLSERLDSEMRFIERDAVDYAIAIMRMRRHPSFDTTQPKFDVNNALHELANFMANQYKPGNL